MPRSPIPRGLRQLVLWALPERYRVPSRYYYRRLLGIDHEIGVLKDLVGTADTAIDIGANLGVYTYALWKLCRRVVAFEPLPAMAAGLRAFDSSRLTVHQVALSVRPGTQQLYFPRVDGEVDFGRGSLSPHDGALGAEVTVRTLDEYCFDNVSFIKIDVEGHELEVLQGGVATLRRNRPALMVEIEQRHLDFPMGNVFEFLEGLGYQGSFIQDGQLRPLAEFSVERHQQQALARTYSEGYVNNFVFRT